MLVFVCFDVVIVLVVVLFCWWVWLFGLIVLC